MKDKAKDNLGGARYENKAYLEKLQRMGRF